MNFELIDLFVVGYFTKFSGWTITDRVFTTEDEAETAANVASLLCTFKHTYHVVPLDEYIRMRVEHALYVEE